jgi:hypothetical protein
MKTERRHELQTNTLSEVLGHQIEGIRPHATKLLAAGVLGAVVVITIAMITKDRAVAQEQARNDLYMALAAQDREALKDVAKTHTGSPISWWAKKAQADIDLSNGLAALYINRDEAFQSLDDAKKAYTEVMNGASNIPELVRYALFGLASANEASSNLDKAKEFYERVIQQYPDTPMAAESKARLEALKDPQTEKWYTWFARQKPKPRPSMSGMPNFPGISGMPTDLGSLPDSSDLGPATLSSESPASAPPSSAVPVDTKPPATESKDAPAAPAASPAAESKPADASSRSEATDAKPEAAPPADKPAESEPAEPKAKETDSTPPAKPSSDTPSP